MKKYKNKSVLEPILIVPDTHIPYHNKRAWRLLLKAAAHLKPQHIIICGDFADFYSVSSHDKDPLRGRLLKTELLAVNKCLDDLDNLGAVNKLFIAGNHEDRLNRYLSTNAPELTEMVDLVEQFKLGTRGWKYAPYKTSLKLGKLNITHDTGTAGPTAHLTALNDFQENVIIGHTHRMAYVVKGNANGVPHIGAMFGWLGDVDKVDYMHKIKAKRDWASGFGYGYLRPSNGYVYLTPCPIVGSTCVVNGELISL